MKKKMNLYYKIHTKILNLFRRKDNNLDLFLKKFEIWRSAPVLILKEESL